MKEKTKQRIIDLSFAIMFIVILIFSLTIILNAQKDMSYSNQTYCDDLYGKDNWTMVDITGTLKADNIAGRFYIGQVWECRPYASTSFQPPYDINYDAACPGLNTSKTVVECINEVEENEK